MNDIIKDSLSLLKRDNLFLYNTLLFHKTHENKNISFFKPYNYLTKIYQDKSDSIVIKKSTQSGISEYLISFSINESIQNRNILYILPTELIRTRFVTARINKTVEYSKKYQSYLKNMDSVNLKAFGNGVINFIGSNSTSGFTEFVANHIIIDELDECNQQNLAMASERQSAQIFKRTLKISNPTIQDYGIDYEYNKSDKKLWYVKCNNCNEYINLDFFKNVVKQIDDTEYLILDQVYNWNENRDIYIYCDKCNKPIDRFNKGIWIKQNQSNISGYQISKLFSTAVTIKEIVERFKDGLKSDIKMQRFYNGDLGIAYTATGAKITEKMLRDISQQYNMKQESENPCVCGIDVGSNLTTFIAEMISIETAIQLRIIYHGELKELADIIDLTRRFNIIAGVIDARPESRLSRQLVALHKGFFMADYIMDSAKDSIDIKNRIYKVDRTTSLDSVKEMILLKNLIIPEALYNNNDFREQMTASTRVYQENDNGEGRYVWVEGNKPDHAHHAVNYMILAKKLLVMLKR